MIPQSRAQFGENTMTPPSRAQFGEDTMIPPSRAQFGEDSNEPPLAKNAVGAPNSHRTEHGTPKGRAGSRNYIIPRPQKLPSFLRD